MKKIAIILIALLCMLVAMAPRSNSSPHEYQASTEVIEVTSLAEPAPPWDPTVLSYCHLMAQVYLNIITEPNHEINTWPWYRTGCRTPFLFYDDWHTQIEIKNIYYGYPAYTWILLNIDSSPNDGGFGDWAVIPCPSC